MSSEHLQRLPSGGKREIASVVAAANGSFEERSRAVPVHHPRD